MAQTRLTKDTKDTILGMKLAIARYQDCKTLYRGPVVRHILTLLPAASDSDDPYLQPTNRGNKLKRKAHHMQDAYSGRITGAKAYTRVSYNLPYHLFCITSLTYSARRLSMPATEGIYFAETPSATMKTERSLKIRMKMRKLMRGLRKKTHMLKSSSKVSKSEL